VVQRPQPQVLVLRTADQPASGDGEAGDRVEVGRLEGGKDVEVVDVHPADTVVARPIIEDVLVRSLARQTITKVKISWFFYFSSRAWLGLSFLKSQTSRLPPFAVPFPPVKM
jgi:hypothetical protein